MNGLNGAGQSQSKGLITEQLDSLEKSLNLLECSVGNLRDSLLYDRPEDACVPVNPSVQCLSLQEIIFLMSARVDGITGQVRDIRDTVSVHLGTTKLC